MEAFTILYVFEFIWEFTREKVEELKSCVSVRLIRFAWHMLPKGRFTFEPHSSYVVVVFFISDKGEAFVLLGLLFQIHTRKLWS